MRKGLALILTLAACFATLPALAAKERVAVLPAGVLNAAPGNSARVTEALRASLSKHGYELLDQATIERALRERRLVTSRPLPSADLARLRDALGVDYLVYSRLLNIGVSVNSDQLQANLLVNTLGKTGNAFLHSRQVGQLLASRDRSSARTILLTPTEANEAAQKLMAPFYEKVGK